MTYVDEKLINKKVLCYSFGPKSIYAHATPSELCIISLRRNDRYDLCIRDDDIPRPAILSNYGNDTSKDGLLFSEITDLYHNICTVDDFWALQGHVSYPVLLHLERLCDADSRLYKRFVNDRLRPLIDEWAEMRSRYFTDETVLLNELKLVLKQPQKIKQELYLSNSQSFR